MSSPEILAALLSCVIVRSPINSALQTNPTLHSYKHGLGCAYISLLYCFSCCFIDLLPLDSLSSHSSFGIPTESFTKQKFDSISLVLFFKKALHWLSIMCKRKNNIFSMAQKGLHIQLSSCQHFQPFCKSDSPPIPHRLTVLFQVAYFCSCFPTLPTFFLTNTLSFRGQFGTHLPWKNVIFL